MDARQGRGNGYAPESWKTLCELERTLSVKLVSSENQKGTLLSSEENASTVGADEARGSTRVDSRFDVFLDAAKELDRRGKSTAGEGGNLISTQEEDGMTEKERRRLEATRAKNRRAQKRFREKTKMNMLKMEADVNKGLKEIEFLRHQNRKLFQDRLILTFSTMLRKELVITYTDKNNIWKFRLPEGLAVTSETESDSSSVCVPTTLDEMRKAKVSLQESIEAGGDSYKDSLSAILGKFWSVAELDAMKFGELLQLGTACNFTTKAAWTAIMSKVSSIDREFMFKMYNNFKKGQEKLSEYLSSTLSHLEDSSPESVESSVMSVPNIKTSIELSRLNQVSLEFFALYCEAYVHLQQRISMKDLAHIWAESPTVIPDVMSLLIALLQ